MSALEIRSLKNHPVGSTSAKSTVDFRLRVASGLRCGSANLSRCDLLSNQKRFTFVRLPSICSAGGGKFQVKPVKFHVI